MARAENLKSLSIIAGAAVRVYRFLQLQADGKYDEVGVAEGRADGISVEATVTGDEDNIAMAPLSQPAVALIEAGAAVSVGDLVSSDAQGRAKTAAAAGAGNHVAGVALTAAGAAGEIIEVQLRPFLNAAS